MKISNFKLFTLLSIMVISIATLNACSDDDGLTANITVNEGPSGDIGGDFTGDGGNVSRVIEWINNTTTADYNADITSTATGVFQIVVADAEGTVVLDRSLRGDTEPDTIDGVTSSGVPGPWSVTITLTSFSGDGSYSLSAGN